MLVPIGYLKMFPRWADGKGRELRVWEQGSGSCPAISFILAISHFKILSTGDPLSYTHAQRQNPLRNQM